MQNHHVINEPRRNRVAIAVKAAIAASLILPTAGCLVEGSRDRVGGTSGIVEQINHPVGTVQGLVQDTNGNPLEGVVVYLGAQMATTNAGGMYVFEDVRVTQAAGANANVPNNVLSLTIIAPENHLGATVTISPQAQIESNVNQANNVVNPNTLFMDGFVAQAGTAVLPRMGASASGTLRHAVTQAPLANTIVSLDYIGVQTGQGQTQPHNGVAFSYTGPSFVVTTDANGRFSFSNLPVDSIMALAAQGYTAIAIGNLGAPGIGGQPQLASGTFNTVNEEIEQTLGQVFATPIVDADTIEPVVAAVAEVRDNFGVAGGVLINNPSGRPTAVIREGDTLDTITVVFSEALTQGRVDNDSVVIWDSTNNTYVTGFSVALSAGGNVATITLDNPLDATVRRFLEVYLMVDDFKDLAGNPIRLAGGVTGPVGFGGNVLPNVGFDSQGGAGPCCDRRFLRLDICSLGDAALGADAVTVTQLALPQTANPEAASVSNRQNYSGAFNDVEDANNWFADGVNVDQLNHANAPARLQALGDALFGGVVPVNVQRGLITFTAGTAATHTITAATGAQALNVTLATQGLVDTNAAANVVALAGIPSGTVVEVLVSNGVGVVTPGVSTVTVVPADDFGNGATPTTITLVDNVEPTVVLQRAHGLAGIVGAGAVGSFGAGAEISEGGITAQLSPAWRVNGGHFTESRTTSDPVARRLQNASAAGMINNPVTITTVTNANQGDPVGVVYDRTGYEAWNNKSFTSAIEMSEPLASASLSYNGATATISNVAVANGINQTVWGENGNLQNAPADLVMFAVNNIEAMASDGRAGNTRIDMVGSVDTATNVSAANAYATVVDNFPPLITSAVFAAEGITLVANEPLDLTGGYIPTIHINYNGVNGGAANTIAAQAIRLDQNWAGPCPVAGTNTVQLSNSNQTVFIPICYAQAETAANLYDLAFDAPWIAGNPAARNSPLGDYTEAAYALGQTDNYHTALSWSNVRDSQGNSWSQTLPLDVTQPNPNYGAACIGPAAVPAGNACLKWTNLGRVATAPATFDGAGQSPIFAMIDGVGEFVVTVNNAAFRTTNVPNTNGSFLFTYSHPTQVDTNPANPATTAMGGGAGSPLTQAQCNIFFTYVPAGGASDFGAGSDCNVRFQETGTNAYPVGGVTSQVEVRFVLDAPITSGDIVRPRLATDRFESAITGQLATQQASTAD